MCTSIFSNYYMYLHFNTFICFNMVMTTTISNVFVYFKPVIWAEVKYQKKKKKKKSGIKMLKLTLYSLQIVFFI